METKPATYVLWVATRREEYTKGLIESFVSLRSHYSRIWIPQKAIHHRLKGDRILVHQILFPGYILIDADDFYDFKKALIDFRIDSRIHLLGDNQEAMKGRKWTDKDTDQKSAFVRNLVPVSDLELEYIQKLSADRPSDMVVENKQVTFVDGPMMGMEAYVQKVDFKRGNCLIVMDFFGQPMTMWVAINLVR